MENGPFSDESKFMIQEGFLPSVAAGLQPTEYGAAESAGSRPAATLRTSITAPWIRTGGSFLPAAGLFVVTIASIRRGASLEELPIALEGRSLGCDISFRNWRRRGRFPTVCRRTPPIVRDQQLDAPQPERTRSHVRAHDEVIQRIIDVEHHLVRSRCRVQGQMDAAAGLRVLVVPLVLPEQDEIGRRLRLVGKAVGQT